MADIQRSGDVGRERRVIKLSVRAQELQDAGEELPGLPTPHEPPEATTPRAGKHHLPLFSPETWSVYHWPSPRPKNFLALAEHHRTWKQDADIRAQSTQYRDGADNWDNFCVVWDVDDECRGSGKDMAYTIATCFSNRAKRACWLGKSFREFEMDERNIDSEVRAKKAQDPEKKALLELEVLDNELRLEVFDAIKERLCLEIWLERYGPIRDSKVPSPACESGLNASGEQRYPGQVIEGKGSDMMCYTEDSAGRLRLLYK